ncbi:alpha/beta hydrolase [Bacillus sp. FJAT-27251]|uniref:alpha/beta fold hydrolase n=1 Tax=Bacillus sp. FJAT-27251 TaxID=1684142 RepID=UPI0006A77A5D|nr:alpha/beta hydrolase [Bacillus sp. FJAT-27251]
MAANSFAASKTVSGIDIYYEYYQHPAPRETIVLIHGFLSSLFSFRHLVPLLKEDYSVISVDLPPFGKSGKRTSYEYSYKNLARTLTELMDGLNISTYTVIGHSMGGQIALNILHHFSGKARKAVLLCSSGYLKPAGRALMLSSRLPLFHLYVKYHLGRSGVEKNLRNVVHDHSLIDDEMREGYLAPFMDNGIFKGLTRMIRDREGDLPHEALQQIQTPCLLIWGEHDKVVPLSVGKQLARDLPQANLIVLEDTGHLVPEERPEEVASHIRKFIGAPLHQTNS